MLVGRDPSPLALRLWHLGHTESYFNQHLLGVPLKNRMSLPSAEVVPHSPFLGLLVAIPTEIWGFTHMWIVFPVDKIIIVNKLRCSRMIKVKEKCVCALWGNFSKIIRRNLEKFPDRLLIMEQGNVLLAIAV